MCDILNGLQSQAFEINKRLLRFLEKNRQCLVECGLLLPNALARVNPTEASDILRECYFNNPLAHHANSSLGLTEPTYPKSL